MMHLKVFQGIVKLLGTFYPKTTVQIFLEIKHVKASAGFSKKVCMSFRVPKAYVLKLLEDIQFYYCCLKRWMTFI